MRKVALVTGITGQDGSYLAELLLEKDYIVHGLIRRSSNFNTQRIDHIFQDPHEKNLKLFLHYGDITDPISVSNLITEIKPTEIYNLAGQSHVQVSFSLPRQTHEVNALGALSILEALKASKIKCRFYQASTSEIFGSTPPPQNEDSPFIPQSPYAVSKLSAYWTTINYRQAYGLHASNGILFNHESPRRGKTFVTRKITRAAARIANGSSDKLYLGNLDSVRDWGYAKEYVHSMWLMLQQDTPGDYVIATGEGSTVRDFAEYTFQYIGLNYENYVISDERYNRPNEVHALIGDSSKASKLLNWRAQTNWKNLAKLMVDSDINDIKN